MIKRNIIIALSAAFLLAAPAGAKEQPAPPAQAEAAAPETASPAPEATAQDSAANETLLPQSVNLSLVEGSMIPTDCQYPQTISDTETFELACVTMPRFSAGTIGAEYLAELGQMGWVQGDYIEGGMTAVRTDENNCERVLNIFPSDFPVGETRSASTVIWFVLERTPRCAS